MLHIFLLQTRVNRIPVEMAEYAYAAELHSCVTAALVLPVLRACSVSVTNNFSHRLPTALHLFLGIFIF